ncbi:SusC/RagA family TonB-linked outer membrane protein [Pseudochryseolinea flava]|uniref:TonB-dependent receptor n=1 Tax=Pseudochryseolinea flava TaxID=2059302 RepID=A0A364Y078_9BACT|nr:TonB-dependent receptor [Pseudochryseolinea flava]RAW00055.1 TonB-dependent receptor [Pseudochryseolinea flava]
MSKIYKKISHVPLLVLAMLLTTASVYAQQKVSGTVTDGTGAGMPGVNIVKKGTAIGTTTDADGNFIIEASPDDVLTISFIGYNTSEVKVGNQTEFKVTLVEDVETLGEVVIVGYGEMKRTDLSSAQVSVSSEQISKSVNTTFEQALQGRAANVMVTQNTGQPGGGVSVNIRGVTSLTGNTQPLYVIDGVQIEGATGGRYGFASSSNPLAGINASDIESMEVLQGPSATAIFGSRAANGVVLITTKRGKAGETKINYSFGYSLQDKPESIALMTLPQYAEFSNAASAVNGTPPRVEFADPSLLGKGTDWQDAIFQRAPMTKHQLSFSGGSEKTTYYFSVEDLSQDGIALGSWFKRRGIRLNVENQTRKWLKLSTNVQLNQTRESLTTTTDQLIITAIEQDPSIPVKNPDGSWGGPFNVEFQFSSPNPIALATINDRDLRRTNIIGGGSIDITPIPGLLIKNSLNTSLNFSRGNLWEPNYQWGGVIKPAEQRRAAKETGNGIWWGLTSLVQYNKKIGQHDITVMASHEAQENTWNGFSGSLEGHVTNNIPEFGDNGSLGNSDRQRVSSYKGSNALESYFGRVVYVYDEKYILQGTIRRDGSSNFGPRRKWGTFPSVSLAWRISEESFFDNIKAVENLKLRLETGIVGNQGGRSFYGALNSTTTWLGSGYLLGNYDNPDLGWEETKAYNVGLDVSLFNNRVEVIADAYYNTIDNLIMDMPLPDIHGTNGDGAIGKPPVNIGVLQNKGFGITINTVNTEGKLKWRTGFNFSVARNTLKELYNDAAYFDRTQWFMTGFIQRSSVGNPVWGYLVYEKEGIIQNEAALEAAAIPATNSRSFNSTWVGDIQYKDQLTVDTDGDGKPDAGDGKIDVQDQIFGGNPWPKFTFGMTNDFTYGNFDLSVLLTGSYGSEIFNQVRFKYENPNGAGIQRNLMQRAFDFARLGTDEAGKAYVINEGTSVPRVGGANGNGNRATQDYIEDGSYIRIKNVQLGYNIPPAILQKLKVINKARVAIGVQNLHTFTKYSGYDPEVGAFTGNNAVAEQPLIGVDYGRYPLTRMYNVSVDIQF